MALENKVFPVKLGMTSFLKPFPAKVLKVYQSSLETQYILQVTLLKYQIRAHLRLIF